ncbi:chloride channel CLIC-like protein 1 [Labeo rohita]|uniref:chloride channel CLIC-like protein 1 n=1 Tax=Labeo rohita TaxID=84645 RepID=UPI0021E1C2B8|nr:chloride channel CLIC-like protein 1 [Labeo rohita]
MKVSIWSSFGFWSLLILCSLCIITNANINQNEEDDVNPLDVINYDPVTKRMRKPAMTMSQQCPDVSECTSNLVSLQKAFDEQKKKGTTTSIKPIFKRFLSRFLKDISKVGLPDDAQTSMHYDAEVKLTKQSLVEIQKFLNEENNWTTGTMDEALSEILVRIKLHDYKVWRWRFEDTFYVDTDTALKVSLIVLIVVVIICTELWSVVFWFVQFWRMFAVCFFISLIWNWFHFYMVAYAEHKKNIVEVESFNAKCTGLKQLDWMDSLAERYRRTWTLQDDPCKKYYEVLLVNPILLVPPTKAITVTITSFITDPMKQIGQGINEFLRALLKDLPVILQLPVLLIFALAIFVFMFGAAQASIHQAFRLPWPWRRDPPPPAVGQHQAHQLREYEETWEGGDAPQSLQHNRSRGNQARNQGDQGFGARYANVPRYRQEDRNMYLREDFSSIPKGRQRVETLHATGNMSRYDETDFQKWTERVIPCTTENAEPEVKAEEMEINVSVDKKEQKDTQKSSPNISEAETNLPSFQTCS